MDWALFSNVVTAGGVLVAAGGVLSNFQLNRLARRHERVRRLKDDISTFKSSLKQLDRLLSTHTAHRLATDLVQSRVFVDLVSSISEKLSEWFENDGEANEEEIRQNFPDSLMLTKQLGGDVRLRYEAIVDNLRIIQDRYEITLPGFSSVVKACYLLHYNVFNNATRVVGDSKEVTDIIVSFIVKKRPRTAAALRALIKEFFLSLFNLVFSRAQATVDCAQGIAELVATAYLRAPEPLIDKQSRYEQVVMPDVSKCKFIYDELKLIEPCIFKLLNDDERLKYERLITKWEQSESRDH